MNYKKNIQRFLLGNLCICSMLTAEESSLEIDLSDDWGDEKIVDTKDKLVESNWETHPWTHYQSRSAYNQFLPSSQTFGKNKWYHRISHVSMEDPGFHNFLGLDDSVKIGILVGYGITEDLDVMLQRVNGRSMDVYQGAAETTSFDYWEVSARYQILNQFNNDYCSLSSFGGVTTMLTNQGPDNYSINAGVIAEKLFWNDRLRIGTGLAFASMSTYEASFGGTKATKLFSVEHDALTDLGQSLGSKDDEHTVSIPVSVHVGITKTYSAFLETIVPVLGYTTDMPAATIGGRINSGTHEFSIYLTNTANITNNGVISGGDQTVLFAFSISAFF